MAANHFKYSKENPTHLSVGAVVINDKNEVLCHYFEETPKWKLKNIYMLMRETIEPDETIESAIHRGLMEEFGVTGEITGYLGPIISHFYSKRLDDNIEKTTIYFLVKLIKLDESKRDPNDPEFASQIQWYKPEFLIPKMKEQGKHPGRSDLDESSILERLLDARTS